MIDQKNLGKHRDVIVFVWDVDDLVDHFVFSVGAAQPHKESAKSRTIVYCTDQKEGKKRWTCSKDGNEICVHIRRAALFLDRLTPGSSEGLASIVDDNTTLGNEEPIEGAQYPMSDHTCSYFNGS